MLMITNNANSIEDIKYRKYAAKVREKKKSTNLYSELTSSN